MFMYAKYILDVSRKILLLVLLVFRQPIRVNQHDITRSDQVDLVKAIRVLLTKDTLVIPPYDGRSHRSRADAMKSRSIAKGSYLSILRR